MTEKHQQQLDAEHTRSRQGGTPQLRGSTGAAWLATVLGVWRLWAAGKSASTPWSTRTLLGSLVLGWGLFNFIEGLIDHQLLGVHHVHPGQDQLAWDLGFLAFGLLEIALGVAVVRGGRFDTTPPGAG